MHHTAPFASEPADGRRVPLPEPLAASMDCRAFRKSHLAYVDGTLPESEQLAMREHRDLCLGCASHDTRLRRALMVARSLPPIRPSAGFAERLEQRLREAKAVDLHEWTGVVKGGRGPGIGEFMAAAAGVVAAGLVATAAIERFRSHEIPMMPAVVASLPDTPALPLTSPAFVASASPIASVWPAALLLDQAPLHFATAQLAGRSVP